MKTANAPLTAAKPASGASNENVNGMVTDTTAATSVVAFVRFSHREDNRPRPAVASWEDLAQLLTTFRERGQKDGPAWSPARYQPGTTRGKKNVVEITAIALDFDHADPPWAQLEPYAYATHSTHSHAAEDPRWRVVLPLAEPVAAAAWPAVWARAQHCFGAVADEACKDCSRLWYWPTCKPGAERFATVHEGRWLRVDDLPSLPPPSAKPSNGTVHFNTIKVGDVHPYAARALEDEIARVARCPAGNGQAGNGRNTQLNKSAFALGQLVGGGLLQRHQVEQALEDAADRCGLVQDDGIAAVQRTITSGLDAGEAEPRRVPADPPPLRLQPANQLEPAAPSGVDAGGPAAYHLTDLGNAQRLVAEHGRDLRYSGELNKWLVYDRRRWAVDTTAEVERRAKATVRHMYARAADEDLEDKARKDLVKHALKSEGHRQLSAMIALARSEPGIPITTEQLDRDPWLLNVQNGTLDLRTATLHPHRHGDLITKLCPVDYDPSATCPTWLAFLDRIMAGRQDLVRFLQRVFGYTLTGSTRERILLILYGGGANGKTTLLETWGRLMGDYGDSTRPETLLAKTYDGGIPNDLAALRGARYVSTAETEDGRRLAEALVKAVTGGDRITARFMRGEFFTFRPAFKLWVATNHKPTIRGTDRAIWDRIRLIPFDVRIPDDQQDKELPAKLAAELPGILAWSLQGCLDWQQHGLGLPTAVRDATAAYRAEMDVLQAFIDDECVVADGAQVTAAAIYEAYGTWCGKTGEKAMSQKALGLRLEEKGFRPDRNKALGRFWRGIGPADQARQTTLGDASDRVTHGDANSGINGLSASHGDLLRKTRHHASPAPDASPAECEDDSDAV